MFPEILFLILSLSWSIWWNGFLLGVKIKSNYNKTQQLRTDYQVYLSKMNKPATNCPRPQTLSVIRREAFDVVKRFQFFLRIFSVRKMGVRYFRSEKIYGTGNKHSSKRSCFDRYQLSTAQRRSFRPHIKEPICPFHRYSYKNPSLKETFS